MLILILIPIHSDFDFDSNGEPNVPLVLIVKLNCSFWDWLVGNLTHAQMEENCAYVC